VASVRNSDNAASMRSRSGSVMAADGSRRSCCVGGRALRARRMHTWRCAGAAQRSQAERPAGGTTGGVSYSLALAHSPTPVRAAFCGPFLPLRERGRTIPVNNIRAVPSHYVASPLTT
jgi:hypothetical protein